MIVFAARVSGTEGMDVFFFFPPGQVAVDSHQSRSTPRHARIDKLAPADIVEGSSARTGRRCSPRSAREASASPRGVEIHHAGLRKGGRIIFVGAGTSGPPRRLEFFADEEAAPFRAQPALVLAIHGRRARAGDRAREGSKTQYDEGARSIKPAAARRERRVIGVSASGMTSFVRGALTRARDARPVENRLRNLRFRETGSRHSCDSHDCAGRGAGESSPARPRAEGRTADPKRVLNLLTTASMIPHRQTYATEVDVQMVPRSYKDRARRIHHIVTGLGTRRADKL